MKVACVKDDKIVIEEAPKPSLKDGLGALVKTLGCGLCGSDIVKFRQGSVKNGTVLGHEIVGEIVDINSKTGFKVGDRIVSSHHIPCLNCVYCKNGNYSMCAHFKETNIVPGGFSEYVYLSEEHLQNVAVKIPDNLTEIEASFYEPLGCCIRAIKRAELKPNSKVLVIGLGSIGILMGQALKAYQAEVFGCDILKERIDFANKIGIKSYYSSEVKNLQVDAVFMTSGADVTIDLALKEVRDGGKIIVFASTPKNFGYANNEIYYRELTVLGSYSPAIADLKDSINLLASKKIKVDNISTVYELKDIDKAFRDTIENKILKAYIKVK
ncbi:MAG: alcohol dehydrogenase catalytic domain-containing protein [Candidatus Gastranaerophilales bacterium]|nr:alcohol dehydrogenase catalytic domain-containing protein [Candidatus Gastranaerophilales bacterium]